MNNIVPPHTENSPICNLTTMESSMSPLTGHKKIPCLQDILHLMAHQRRYINYQHTSKTLKWTKKYSGSNRSLIWSLQFLRVGTRNEACKLLIRDIHVAPKHTNTLMAWTISLTASKRTQKTFKKNICSMRTP